MYLQLSESNIFCKQNSFRVIYQRINGPAHLREKECRQSVCGGGGRAAKRQSHFEIDRNSYNTVLSNKGVDTKF